MHKFLRPLSLFFFVLEGLLNTFRNEIELQSDYKVKGMFK